MSVQTALKFIQRVRQEQSVQIQLLALGPGADLDEVAKLGEGMGFSFTSEEMQAAFKHDWVMRWAFYGGGKTDSNNPILARLENDGE